MLVQVYTIGEYIIYKEHEAHRSSSMDFSYINFYILTRKVKTVVKTDLSLISHYPFEPDNVRY